MLAELANVSVSVTVTTLAGAPVGAGASIAPGVSGVGGLAVCAAALAPQTSAALTHASHTSHFLRLDRPNTLLTLPDNTPPFERLGDYTKRTEYSRAHSRENGTTKCPQASRTYDTLLDWKLH